MQCTWGSYLALEDTTAGQLAGAKDSWVSFLLLKSWKLMYLHPQMLQLGPPGSAHASTQHGRGAHCPILYSSSSAAMP